MQICITSGTGSGPTPLAAFDAALMDAGVANYNLIYLSSVIPPNSLIKRTKYITPPSEYGRKLYVVIARQDEKQPGKSAWAGLGWVQDHVSGCGLFVELHEADSVKVSNNIQATLNSMVKSRPIVYGEIETEIVGVECHSHPVCALVIAVYQSEGWV